MAKYRMNIFDGEDGSFIGTMEHNKVTGCQRLITIELNLLNAVEWFDNETNQPIANYKGRHFKTDTDGFCSLVS